MKLRLERKRFKIGEVIELPDFSFNHAYNFLSDEEIEVTYLVPVDREEAIKAMRSEIAAHILGEYK